MYLLKLGSEIVNSLRHVDGCGRSRNIPRSVPRALLCLRLYSAGRPPSLVSRRFLHHPVPIRGPVAGVARQEQVQSAIRYGAIQLVIQLATLYSYSFYPSSLCSLCHQLQALRFLESVCHPSRADHRHHAGECPRVTQSRLAARDFTHVAPHNHVGLCKVINDLFRLSEFRE